MKEHHPTINGSYFVNYGARIVLAFFLFGLCFSCSHIDEDSYTIYFYGDSHVRNWDLDYWFPHFVSINRGIAGYKVTDLVKDLDSAPGSRRKVVWIGINDILALSAGLERGLLIDSVLYNFKILLDDGLKDAIVLSICPVSQEFDDRYNHDINLIVDEINKEVRILCGQVSINYVDIYSVTMKDFILRDEFTQDGIHLNNLGYEAISKKLREYLY